MDYDAIFKDNIARKFFYTDYPGNKMVVGKISLKNALARMSMHEYYVLVTYMDGEKLPEQYIPLGELDSDDGTLFATINPGIDFTDICQKGGIQRISNITGLNSETPKYLLGPGPETVLLDDLIMEQYTKYYGKKVSKTR